MALVIEDPLELSVSFPEDSPNECPCFQVGPPSQYFSKRGHLWSHVFGSQVDSNLSSCVVGLHDWLQF
jgi:hypothetical protein